MAEVGNVDLDEAMKSWAGMQAAMEEMEQEEQAAQEDHLRVLQSMYKDLNHGPAIDPHDLPKASGEFDSHGSHLSMASHKSDSIKGNVPVDVMNGSCFIPTGSRGQSLELTVVRSTQKFSSTGNSMFVKYIVESPNQQHLIEIEQEDSFLWISRRVWLDGVVKVRHRKVFGGRSVYEFKSIDYANVRIVIQDSRRRGTVFTLMIDDICAEERMMRIDDDEGYLYSNSGPNSQLHF